MFPSAIAASLTCLILALNSFSLLIALLFLSSIPASIASFSFCDKAFEFSNTSRAFFNSSCLRFSNLLTRSFVNLSSIDNNSVAFFLDISP